MISQLPEEDLYSRLLRFAGTKGDATIYSSLRQGRASGDRLEEIMEAIIYAQHEEKKRYFDMAVAATSKLNTEMLVKK